MSAPEAIFAIVAAILCMAVLGIGFVLETRRLWRARK